MKPNTLKDDERIVHVLRLGSTFYTMCGIATGFGYSYPQPKSDGRYYWHLPRGQRWCKRCIRRRVWGTHGPRP